MQIRVAKRDLSVALQLARHTMASSGGTDDISVHYLFRVNKVDSGHAVEILTTHKSMFSTIPLVGTTVDIEDGEATMFTVEGKRLRQWLKYVSDASLTLSYDEEESEVAATAPAGTQRFEAIDPTKFRLWDDLVANAKTVATVKASRLSEAFEYTQNFVSEDQVRKANLCVFESRDGKLVAADHAVAVLVTVPGLEETGFRVHGKDAPKFMPFLTAAEEGDVELQEHDRAFLIKLGNGSLVGERKPRIPFPKDLSPDKKAFVDEHWWELSVAEVKRRIGMLTAGANWNDNRLRFSMKDGVVQLSMKTNAGKDTVLEIPCEDHGSSGKGEALSAKGFLVAHPFLTKILSHHEEDVIRFGVNRRKHSGFVRFFWKNDEVEYLSVLVWLEEH